MADSENPAAKGPAGVGCALIVAALVVIGLLVGGGDDDESAPATSAPDGQVTAAEPEDDPGNGEVIAMVRCPDQIERG